MTAPTPPEPVGDWAAWSAAMHARLHPARPADPTPDDLRDFIRCNLSKLPVHVQIEILGAIQEAGHGTLNEYAILNHGALLVALARMSARAAQAGRSAV